MEKEILKKIEGRPARGCWARGVRAYAVELVRGLGVAANAATLAEELTAAMLNGAANWREYSYGGRAVICDLDIAKRLCTPSELKRARGGERNPNSREIWLDVQARALCQAAQLAVECWREARADKIRAALKSKNY